MPQFDIFGNYTLALLFVIFYYMYYFSFVVFMESLNKLFYLDLCLNLHIWLCNACKNEKILWANFVKNSHFRKLVH